MSVAPKLQAVQFDDGEIELPGTITIKCTRTGTTVQRPREYLVQICRSQFDNTWSKLLAGFKTGRHNINTTETLESWRADNNIEYVVATGTCQEHLQYLKDKVDSKRGRYDELILRAHQDLLTKSEQMELVVLKGQKSAYEQAAKKIAFWSID